MEYIVDLQGFRRSSNLLIPKELVIIPVEDKELRLPTICVFQPPCKWLRLLDDERKTNLWLERKFHGIPWQSGSVPHSCLIRILQDSLKDATRVYVKGLEKKKWLEELLPGKFVIDMEDLRCPSLSKLTKIKKIACLHHPLRRNAVCAVTNAYTLKNWLLTRRNEQLASFQGEDVVDIGNSSEPSFVFQEPAVINEKFLTMYS